MDRPSPRERGYDAKHRQLRGLWASRMKRQPVHCWRCGELIEPGTAWDLGHDDNDKTKHRGPEHAAQCNRRAAGIASHERRASRLRPTTTHPAFGE